MKLIFYFLIYPKQFYKKILDGELKLYILILFIINISLSILWELKIGIPLGNYELFFFDKKLLDSLVSVIFNTVVMLTLSGALYIFTRNSDIRNRLEKSCLVVFSLVAITILTITAHLISYYFFGWLIDIQLLFAVTLLLQSVYFFIGVKIVFGISYLRAISIQILCFLLVGVVIFILTYAEYNALISDRDLDSRKILRRSADRTESNAIVQKKRFLQTVDKLRLRDKQHVYIESKIVWNIADQALFKKSIGSIKLAEIRIHDIYEAVMSKTLLIYIYIENGNLGLIGEKKKEKIINRCNQSELRKEFGIEIISLDILQREHP